MQPLARSRANSRPASVGRKIVSALTAGCERMDATLGAPNAHCSVSSPTLPALIDVSRCQRLLAASRPQRSMAGRTPAELSQNALDGIAASWSSARWSASASASRRVMSPMYCAICPRVSAWRMRTWLMRRMASTCGVLASGGVSWQTAHHCL